MPFPVSEALICAAERELGRRLPEALRARLARSNGGEIYVNDDDDDDWVLHPVADPSDRKRLARTTSHIIRETQQARSWRSFPKQAIAIAANGGGDFLIVLPGSDEIEFWDHETGEHQPVSVNWE